MKISIFINPQNSNSAAIQHAYAFIEAALEKNCVINQVFFYGYAVDFAFYQHKIETNCWQTLTQHGVKLYACSTIAENFLGKNEKLIDGFKLSGLAQWLESIHNSDKYIEFS
jgi:sulfur relay (sulfurtransferase) complex TusBCD TusD component (DsrE family)